MRFTEGQWVTFKLHNSITLGWIVSCSENCCTVQNIKLGTYMKSLDLIEAVEPNFHWTELERRNMIDEALRTKDRERFDQLCKGERV